MPTGIGHNSFPVAPSMSSINDEDYPDHASFPEDDASLTEDDPFDPEEDPGVPESRLVIGIDYGTTYTGSLPSSVPNDQVTERQRRRSICDSSDNDVRFGKH